MATMLSTKMQEQQQQQQQFPPEQDHHLKQDHVVHHDPSWYPKEISDEATRPSRRHPSHSSSKGDYDDHGGINLSTISNNEKDLLLLHRPPSLFSVTAVIKIQKAVRIFLKKKKLNDCTNEKKETLTNCREEEEEEEAFAAVVLSSDCKDQQRKRCLSEIISLLKDHLDVRDRMYRFKTYKNCFVASEAIDYMIKTNIVSTRQEGVEFGRLLQIHSHLWHHVCNHHTFKDDYLFFKFTTASNDERKEGERMMMLSLSYDDSRISDITMLDFVRSSTMISSYCEEISEDVSLLDPWGSSASSSSSSKGKEERSNERKADSSIINNVSKGNNNSIKTSSSSSSSSLQQSKVITSPNKEARGIQRPPFKLPHKRLYTKNNRQLSAETDTAVIADCPVSLPVRRESALQMLDYDVSSLTFSYDDTTISANTRRSCNILNNGSNSITTDSSSSGHGRVVDNNNKNDFTRKKEATMSSEFHVVADDSPIQPPKRRQSKLSIPHNHHHTTIMEDIPSSIRESSSRRNDDDDLHIKNSKTQTTSMRRSELDNNMVVVASGDSPIQPPKRRQSEAVDTIDMTSYTSSSSSSFGCCNTTIDIQNDNHSSSSSSSNNNRSWSSRNGIINNDLQQQRFLASPSSSPHNLKKKKNVTSSEGVVAQTQQNRTIDSPLNVPKRRVSDDKNTVNT